MMTISVWIENVFLLPYFKNEKTETQRNLKKRTTIFQVIVKIIIISQKCFQLLCTFLMILLHPLNEISEL